MFPKTVFAFAILLLGSTSAGPLQSTEPQQLVSIIKIEQPCVLQGGLCLPEGDCPEDRRVSLPVILCPAQHYLNVTCCYT